MNEQIENRNVFTKPVKWNASSRYQPRKRGRELQVTSSTFHSELSVLISFSRTVRLIPGLIRDGKSFFVVCM